MRGEREHGSRYELAKGAMDLLAGKERKKLLKAREEGGVIVHNSNEEGKAGGRQGH